MMTTIFEPQSRSALDAPTTRDRYVSTSPYTNDTHETLHYGNELFGPQQYTAPRPAQVAEPQLTAPQARRGVPVDQGRYWVGALLTSGVAAMAGVIGVLIAQDLLRVPLTMSSIGLGAAHMSTYGLFAAVVALLAAGAYDAMLLFAPRPTIYFCWLTGLLTALAVLLPFTVPVAIGAQVALAIINLVVGVAVMTLVPVAATNARAR